MRPKHSSLLTMRGITQGKVVPIIFVTGSTVSVISESFFRELGTLLDKETVEINCINSSFDCLGQTSLELIIGLITSEIELFIISTELHGIIMGLDYLQNFNL